MAPVLFGDKTFVDRIYDGSSADNNNILRGAGAIAAGGALGLPFDNEEYPIPEPLPTLPGYEPLDPAWINNVFTADYEKGTKGQVTPDLPKTREELYEDLKDLLVMDNHREATKHGKVQMVSL